MTDSKMVFAPEDVQECEVSGISALTQPPPNMLHHVRGNAALVLGIGASPVVERCLHKTGRPQHLYQVQFASQSCKKKLN